MKNKGKLNEIEYTPENWLKMLEEMMNVNKIQLPEEFLQMGEGPSSRDLFILGI